MFCFKLWSRFAVFRDPLTITQNLTFPFPPKTTVGGMLAAILGIESNSYFKDRDYFNFKYSLVLNGPIRKKSFAQNYVEDYTKKSEMKISKLGFYFKINSKKARLESHKYGLLREKELVEEKYESVDDVNNRIKKNSIRITEAANKSDNLNFVTFTSAKPIYRELIISPQYLIFIDDFKYEKKIVGYMKKHFTRFALYMGNSEFAANYKYIECTSSVVNTNHIDTFTAQPELINFEPDKNYINLYMATKTILKREYRDYKNIVISDSGVNLDKQIQAKVVETPDGVFNCEFI